MHFEEQCTSDCRRDGCPELEHLCVTCKGTGVAEYRIPAHQGWVNGQSDIIDEEISTEKCEDCQGKGTF